MLFIRNDIIVEELSFPGIKTIDMIKFISVQIKIKGISAISLCLLYIFPKFQRTPSWIFEQDECVLRIADT